MVKASLVGAGLLALTAVRADAAVIPLNATDVWTGEYPQTGAAVVDNQLFTSYNVPGGRITAFDKNGISLGPTPSYPARDSPLSDLASVDGKLAQLVDNTAYLTNLSGQYVDDFVIGTNIVGIGGTKINVDSYITWVKADGTYGALNIATRQNQTLGTISGLPSDATRAIAFRLPGPVIGTPGSSRTPAV